MRHALRPFVLAAALAGGGAGVAGADNLALVVGNEDYRALPDQPNAGFARRHADALEDAGFRVFEARNVDTDDLLRQASAFARAAGESSGDDRFVVVLSGHFAHSDHDSWLLGREADEVSDLDVGASGLSLAAILDLMAEAPGQAILLLDPADDTRPLGRGLDTGIGTLDIPQGVTVLRGSTRQTLRMLRDGLLVPGRDLSAAVSRGDDGIEIEGFVSSAVSLLPAPAREARPAPTPEPERRADTGELAYWAAARDIGTVESLRNYLERYPQGDFVSEANAMIREIREAPQKRAEAIEAEISLGRDARRQIQRNLSLLGFDSKGIDGLFGPATRSAISKWQDNVKVPVTGYLTREQITLLQRQADRRAAELEEEARQRREIEERKDRAYWQDTGQGEDENGLRAYLKRYPDGVYAELAQSRLDEIEARRRAEVRANVREAWDSARAGDTIASYRGFLDQYPKSGFAEAARQRIDQLQQGDRNAAQVDADKREESAIASTGVARLLIEKQLDQYGTKPGAIDGNFTDETRRAIRRFQKSQKLPVTGFVSQQTMVRLMAGAFR